MLPRALASQQQNQKTSHGTSPETKTTEAQEKEEHAKDNGKGTQTWGTLPFQANHVSHPDFWEDQML